MKTAVYLTSDQVERPFMSGFFGKSVHYSKVRGQLDPNKHVVFFGSGTDIEPAFYNQRRSRFTQHAHTLRDIFEAACWAEVQYRSIPSIGICRGAQLITALVGGRLWQHVTNHAGPDHKLKFWDNRPGIYATSVHHQMMFPYDLPKEDYQVLATTEQNLSEVYYDGDDLRHEMKEEEPEIVWYPKARALAIQGHPEYCAPEHSFVGESRKLMEQFVLSN
jgi:putative glutamine amidotransferase